jgi:hypothetical protein
VVQLIQVKLTGAPDSLKRGSRREPNYFICPERIPQDRMFTIGNLLTRCRSGRPPPLSLQQAAASPAGPARQWMAVAAADRGGDRGRAPPGRPPSPLSGVPHTHGRSYRATCHVGSYSSYWCLRGRGRARRCALPVHKPCFVHFPCRGCSSRSSSRALPARLEIFLLCYTHCAQT